MSTWPEEYDPVEDDDDDDEGDMFDCGMMRLGLSEEPPMTAPLTERLARGGEGLTELIARLEAATGPDRVLDRDLYALLEDAELRPWRPGARKCWWYARGSDRVLQCSDGTALYTASIDAALALVERVLPGWLVSIMIGHGKAVAHVRDKSILAPDKIEGDGYAVTPALAVLLALLRAVEAEKDGGRG